MGKLYEEAAYEELPFNDPDYDGSSSSSTLAADPFDTPYTIKASSLHKVHRFSPLPFLRRHASGWREALVAICALLCISTIVVVSIDSNKPHGRLVNPPIPPVPDTHLPPICGTSSAEARALGCSFDIFLSSWLPAACWDESINTRARSEQSNTATHGHETFSMYWDEEFTKPAPWQDVEAAALENGEDGKQIRFYTTAEYQQSQCVQQGLLAGSAISRISQGEQSVGVYWKAADRAYTARCGDLLARDDDNQAKEVIVPGVGRCIGLDDVWNSAYGYGGRAKGA